MSKIKVTRIVKSTGHAALLPLAFLLLPSCASNELPDPAPLNEAASAKGELHYSGSVAFSPVAETMAAQFDIEINDPTTRQLTFLLNAMVGEAQVNGPSLISATSELDPRFGGFVRAYTLVLAPPANGEVRSVSFAYSGKPIPENVPLEINSVESEHIELTVDSFWFPFEASFETEITADLTIAVPGEWTGVAPDTITPIGGGFRLEQYINSRDISFTLLSDPVVMGQAPYAVYDARTVKGGKIEEVNRALQGCASFLNGIAGPSHALPSASVIINNRTDSGYSRRTLIALSDVTDSSERSIYQFVCHELAHNWSLANASGPENWHNEGFADALANFAVRETFGEEIYEKMVANYRRRLADKEGTIGPVWTPELTERPDFLVSYRAAPLAFAALEQRIGWTAFERFARAVLTEEVTTTPAMLDALERATDKPTRDWFTELLSHEGTQFTEI